MTRDARSGRLLAVLGVGCAWGALASCNLIVGAGDYVVGDASDDTAAVSLRDTGSPSTGGDAVASPGQEAAVSDATRDAIVVSGNDAGRADAAPDVSMDVNGLRDADAAPLTDFDKLVESCVFAVSCDPYFFPTTISECITEDYLESTTALSCLATIQDCAGYTACQGFANPSATDCPTATAGARCDGNNRAINCNGLAVGAVNDCNKLGGTCGTYVDSTGTTVANCIVVTSCTETDSTQHCSGTTNNIYTCVNGSGYGQSCGAINGTCDTVNGSTSCYFNAPTCASPGYTCAGNTVNWCSPASQEFKFNCSRAGLSCSLDDAGFGSCVAATMTACSESCDGKSTITACVGGAPKAIDCTKYGFTKCSSATDTSTSPGTLYAYCQ